MSYAHKDVVIELEDIEPTPKLVLVHLCDPACENCGLAWRGIPWLARKTGLSENSVRAALRWLESHGHIAVHWQARGGRGFTTEYVVLPGIEIPSRNGTPAHGLQAAPCPKCMGKMKAHPSRK